MGLQSDIGFAWAPANAFQRMIQRFGQTRLGTEVLSRSLRTLDLLVNRLTKGRTTFAGVVGGFPIVMLTTTGARSGRPRTNPVTGIPIGENLAVLGANYGLGVIPAWVHNLRSSPQAELTYREHMVGVVAQEVSGTEAEAIFEAAYRIYPGYAEYRKRFTVPIPVFVLTARSG
jgi:deazaflavin-dependent oxidoreductase (nitroreductase family)